MNHLYIEPIGGLANRMRVIASALEFKKKYGCEVFCVWNKDSSLYAEFNELFEDVDGLNMISKSSKMKKLKSTCQSNLLLRLLAKINNKLLGFYYIAPNLIEKLVNNGVLYSKLKSNDKSIYIRSFIIDYKWSNIHLQNIFRPVESISKKIISINSTFSKYSEVLGLHIRRTDNLRAIANSPIELFIDIIEKNKKDGSIGFFLATDDSDIEFLMKKLYPDELIVIEQKNRSRNSLEGIKSAIVDMYALSKTSFIYGSFWSSFSIISGKLGNVECVLLEKTKWKLPAKHIVGREIGLKESLIAL